VRAAKDKYYLSVIFQRGITELHRIASVARVTRVTRVARIARIARVERVALAF